MKTAKLGRLMPVANTKRRFGSARVYMLTRLQGGRGKREFFAMFTPHEINVAVKRAARNPEDLRKTSWLRRLIG